MNCRLSASTQSDEGKLFIKADHIGQRSGNLTVCVDKRKEYKGERIQFADGQCTAMYKHTVDGVGEYLRDERANDTHAEKIPAIELP